MNYVRLACLALFACTSPAAADDLLIAVAANFAAPSQEIAAAFEAETGIQTDISLGATGLLYAQISQGAPYDVFLAADQTRPMQAVEGGLADPETRVTYALGRLALFSVTHTPGPLIFSQHSISRVAIANPDTAPFGAAAVEVLSRLGQTRPYPFALIRGANAGQAFQFAATGNADLGFVSLSHAATASRGQHWTIPEDMHRPIAQDGVVLTSSGSADLARAFLGFLSSQQARGIIEKYGYGLPNNG